MEPFDQGEDGLDHLGVGGRRGELRGGVAGARYEEEGASNEREKTHDGSDADGSIDRGTTRTALMPRVRAGSRVIRRPASATVDQLFLRAYPPPEPDRESDARSKRNDEADDEERVAPHRSVDCQDERRAEYEKPESERDNPAAAKGDGRVRALWPKDRHFSGESDEDSGRCREGDDRPVHGPTIQAGMAARATDASPARRQFSDGSRFGRSSAMTAR